MTSLPQHLTTTKTNEADICLIVEGSYPYVQGGVSSWINWLIRSQPQLNFSVVSIMPTDKPRISCYEFPDNMIGLHELFLHQSGTLSYFEEEGDEVSKGLAESLISLLSTGGLDDLAAIDRIVNAPKNPISLSDLINSPLAWNVLCRMYEVTMPQASFHHYYWAWRALLGGLFSALKFPLPAARVYHTIATGYAGLVAARARLETDCSVIITEHGIYTNERRIEILMAEWITDTVNKGLSIRDDRFDLREMWIGAFEAYARTCYEACSEITTLYEDNQRLQRPLGADENKLQVIANGIDYERFSNLPRADKTDRPTIALIGRVVPIKDIKTFITAAHLVHERIHNLRVLIMGPTEEDEEYFKECLHMVSELELEEVLEFTGTVKITDYLPKMHVMVLTSLSEAQPLVILEAGAAGIPCIATDVGSCREIIEGRSDEIPNLGQGGIVTDLVAPDQIADAICRLLSNEDQRCQYGQQLQDRVKTYYVTELASKAYCDIYARHGVSADTISRREEH